MHKIIAKKVKDKIVGFFLKPFPLLDDFNSKLFLVIFCGIFSTFFILFYNPLNIKDWNYDSAIGKLLSIWSAGILGAIFLSITQFVFRPRINLSTFNVGQFSLWVALEFFLLSILFFIIFKESEKPLWREFFIALRHTVSLAIIPYFLACLLIAVRKLSQKIKQEKKELVFSSEQLLFKDENGKIMLATKPSQLLFLKSENNYTSVFYLQNGKVEKKLIRTNLKKLERELTYPDLIRIHRSYMVNLQSIVGVHRKKRGFQIQLNKLPEMPLKVSETYKSAFEAQIKR